MAEGRFWKAVDGEGGSFGDPEVVWRVGRIVRDPLPAGRTICERGLLHAATTATEALTSHCSVTYPHRLFVVEPRGDLVRETGHPHKVGCRAWKVVEERPMHEAYGPQGVEVVALIERCGRLTYDDAVALLAAWRAVRGAVRGAAWGSAGGSAGDAAWHAARHAARDAARNAAWVAARHAAWDAARVAARNAAWVAAGDAAGDAARDAARNAALALVVRDLITPEEFEVLYGPWRKVCG